MNTFELKNEFLKGATSPSVWFTYASRLKRSADLLWTPIDETFRLVSAGVDNGHFKERTAYNLESLYHAQAYLLIAGFSLETMLKAAAIQRAINDKGPEAVVGADRTAPRLTWLKTHDLRKLAPRAGLDCNETQLKHLDRFTKYIKWAGRYPVPVEPSGLQRDGLDYQVACDDPRSCKRFSTAPWMRLLFRSTHDGPYGGIRLDRKASANDRDLQMVGSAPRSLGYRVAQIHPRPRSEAVSQHL